MGKTLVIAEKPSVGRDLTRALPGAFQKHEGYLESESHVVTWAVGHLVQLAEPDEYDAKYKKWRMADLPIVPDRFKLVVRDERSKKQMNVVKRLLGRDDIAGVVNACDAGREGELIFAYIYEKSGSRKPVERLWLNSMTTAAIKEAFAALRPAEQLATLEAAARSRSEADWIVGMNATRAATIRLRSSFDGAVSLGRVQTPTRSASSSPSPTGSSTLGSTRSRTPRASTKGATTPAPIPGSKPPTKRRRSSPRATARRVRSPSSTRASARSARRFCTTSPRYSAMPTAASGSPRGALSRPPSACTRSTRR
jgi:hypothetical protein